jgi:hypothetical protein
MTSEAPTPAEQIAQALGETKAAPIRQIEQVIAILGDDTARVLLAETLQIEAKGGMFTEDGRRRRTSGGVFFKLARARLTPEQQRAVFHPTQDDTTKDPG